MRKRILIILMAVSVTASTIQDSSITFASSIDTNYSVYYDDYLRAIENRCVELQEFLNESVGEKQYGLLFQLRVLVQYMLYNQFMIEFENAFGQGLKMNPELYEQDLSKRIILFNDIFGDDSDDFMPCLLNEDFDGITHSATEIANEKADVAFKENILKIIPSYLKSLLAQIQDKIESAEGDEKRIKRIKRENTTLVNNIYLVCEAALEAKQDLAAYTPFNEKGEHKKYSMEADGVSVETAYGEVFANYKELLTLAQDSELYEETEEDIAVDLTRQYVENLSNAVVLSGEVEVPENPRLSLLYYAIMSASSVYVPLQSYAGSAEFQVALKSLTNDDQVQAEMVEFYSAVKDIRKPLYKRELDEYGVPSGTAKLITIQEFLDDIKKGNSGALCTVLGNFDYDSSTNSWLYYQSDFRNLSDVEYDELIDNSSSTITVSGSEESLYVDDGADLMISTVSSTVSSLFNPAIAEASSILTDPTTGLPVTTDSDEDDLEEEEVTSSTVKDTAVFAYTEVTDDTKLSEALYLYGTDYFRDNDNLTSLLLYNCIANSSNLQYIDNKNTRYLYVNAFGDIVTDDNLIIFPGVANPSLYREDESYNIYTAAFMNAYPSCYKTSSSFKLTNKNDIGKYLIVRQSSDKPNAEKEFYAVKTESINSITDSDPIKVKKLYLNFSVDGTDKDKLMKYQRLIFGSSNNWNEQNEVYTYTPLVTSISAKVGDSLVFPYVTTDDPSKEVAKAIAQNMYWYLTSDTTTGKQSETVKLNENFILHYFILNGLGGTNNPKGYSQNTLEQYERYVQNAPERFLTTLKGVSENIREFTSGVRGVIGLREFLQSPILGNLLLWCRSNLVLFFLIILVGLVIVFARLKIGLFKLLVKLIVSLIIVYLFITLLPTYLPMFFNVAINNISENLTYKILAMRTEAQSVGILKEELSETGEVKFNSESITLYRTGVSDYETFVQDMNVDESDMIGGKIKILNANAGTFVEGDSIKINLSRLLSTLKIAEYDGEDKGYYRIKAYKTVSNNVDYYTPFYQFVDQFIKELNLMNKVFNIPKSVLTYSNGTTKDNFLVYSFVNSSIFLHPENYVLTPNSEGLSLDELEVLEDSNTQLLEELTNTFGDEVISSDFLRMNEWIFYPSEEMQKTLWYASMQANGFYDENGNPNVDAINNLIEHINYQTRKFIFAMDDLIGRISDETMIELIALRATVDFNQQISDCGHWVYPFSLNYGDFSLGDVVSTVFVSDYSKFSSMDFDVIEYVGNNDGWFSLLVLDILLVLMFIIVYVVQFLIPIMYVLLGVTVTAKMLMLGDVKLPVKGFIKCLLLIMIGYTVFATGLVVFEKMNGNVISIYAMLAICLLLLYALFVVISSVAFNLADLGNSALTAKIDELKMSSKSKYQIDSQIVHKLSAKRYERSKEKPEWQKTLTEPFHSYRIDSKVDSVYFNQDKFR